jgi:hypothetical protein
MILGQALTLAAFGTIIGLAGADRLRIDAVTALRAD